MPRRGPPQLQCDSHRLQRVETGTDDGGRDPPFSPLSRMRGAHARRYRGVDRPGRSSRRSVPPSAGRAQVLRVPFDRGAPDRSGSSSRATRWRARYSRVVIVPFGAPKTRAASPYERPAISTATRAKRKDSGNRAIAGNTCPVITASSGRASVRRSAGSSSSSGVTARGRRAAVLVLVTKVLRSACVRYASSSPPRSQRGRARILATVSWTRSSALSCESHSADAVRNRRPRCAPRTSGRAAAYRTGKGHSKARGARTGSGPQAPARLS